MLISMWSFNADYPNFADVWIVIKVQEEFAQGRIEMQEY